MIHARINNGYLPLSPAFAALLLLIGPNEVVGHGHACCFREVVTLVNGKQRVDAIMRFHQVKIVVAAVLIAQQQLLGNIQCHALQMALDVFPCGEDHFGIGALLVRRQPDKSTASAWCVCMSLQNHMRIAQRRDHLASST